MPKFTFVCDACGTVFEQEIDKEGTNKPLECPVCHGHEAQLELSLFSTYGYGEPDEGSCSSGNSGFR